jgi:hypothetical protein
MQDQIVSSTTIDDSYRLEMKVQDINSKQIFYGLAIFCITFQVQGTITVDFISSIQGRSGKEGDNELLVSIDAGSNCFQGAGQRSM